VPSRVQGDGARVLALVLALCAVWRSFRTIIRAGVWCGGVMTSVLQVGRGSRSRAVSAGRGWARPTMLRWQVGAAMLVPPSGLESGHACAPPTNVCCHILRNVLFTDEMCTAPFDARRRSKCVYMLVSRKLQAGPVGSSGIPGRAARRPTL